MYAPAPMGPTPPRGRSPLVAIVLVVVLVVVVLGGYAVGGFVYGQGKVNSATDAYNKVVDHENKLTDYFNNLNQQLSSATSDPANATADQINQEKALYLQLATQSQASQPQVTADDNALASADASLKENSWLTVLSKGSIDKADARIGHARAALAVAKTILADSILYGQFYATVDDAALDLDALDTAANKGDLNGVDTAINTLKTDVAKAIQEDKAPGVASEMDAFLNDLQTTAADFAALVAAVRAGNQNGVNQAVNKLDADTKKLEGYDFDAMSTKEQAFYKALIDQYNKEIEAANKS